MIRLKNLWLIVLLAASILAGNCDTNTKDDSKEKQNLMLMLLSGGGRSGAMLSVPGGSFTQSDGAQSFNHIISAFKIAKYEVAYELWYTVRQWAIGSGYNFGNPGMEGHDGTLGAAPTAGNHEPVTTVNWRDAIVWCNAYSQMSGLNPCYTYTSAVIKDSRDSNSTACDNAVCDWNANGYRLPTEGEWQYAASYKDGSSWTPYNYASGATADNSNATATGLVAWYAVNSGNATHDVGTKTANALGIYDMSGNNPEWCWDWYADAYPVSSFVNYRGPASGTQRVMRGAGWFNAALSIAVGSRDSFGATDETYEVGKPFGFRLAMSIPGSNNNSCDQSTAYGEVTIDGVPREVYVKNGVPWAGASFSSGLNATGVVLCFDSICDEQINIWFPGQSTGIFTAHSLIAYKYIVYAVGSTVSVWNSATEWGASGGIFDITGYDSCFVEGTFSGTVVNPTYAVDGSGRPTSHSLTVGSFKACR